MNTPLQCAVRRARSASLQVDHGILPDLAPRLFLRFHANPPASLAIYDLEYERAGHVYSLTGVRSKDAYVSGDSIDPDEIQVLNRYLRARRHPDGE